MKRVLIAIVLGIALISMLCVGVFLGLAFTPVRAQVEKVIDRVAQRANLNLGPRVLSETQAQQTTGANDGILIAGVRPGSPAEQAGLRRGDILMEVNGQAVNNLPELVQALNTVNAGDTVKLSAQRGDQTVTLTATAAEAVGPQTQAGPRRGGLLGIVPCTDDMLRGFGFNHEFNLQSRAGAQIAEVVADSPAQKAGLQPKEWIVAVDGDEVANANALIQRVQQSKPGDRLTLTVENTNGENREVSVTLAENPNAPDQAWLGVRLGATIERQLPNLPANPNNRSPLPVNPPSVNPPLPEGFENGAVVIEVVADGPASQAGLEVGQVILAVNGDKLTTPDELKASITALKPGDQVTLTVAGPAEQSSRDVVVTLGENPDKAGAAYLGIRFGFLQAVPEKPVPGGPVN